MNGKVTHTVLILNELFNINFNTNTFFSGISSLCFTNSGEALYMMSSSELQRISLGTSKVTTPLGTIDLQPLHIKELAADSASVQNENGDDDDEMNQENPEAPVATARVTVANAGNKTPLAVNVDHTNGLHNGIASSESGNSPNKANETITSSLGDITVDSVRDHLNATTTTLCSTTTEETVGK